MKVEIIAELAQGFEGSPEQAKLLVKAAAKAGADSAKFQLVYADELSTPDYQYYDLFSNLEMTDEDWLGIKTTCDTFDIELILDVFGDRGLRLSEKLLVKSIKLHATDINNIGFINSLAASSVERVMLGAGGAYADEIKNAIKILDAKKVILFHGFQGYPTLVGDNQISRLQIWKTIFAEYPNVSLGFSDHVDPSNPSSIALPAFAVGQGALVLEKHLTLGCCMELEDYESAMNPDQFKTFVDSIKNINAADGVSLSSNDFGMSEAEKQYRTNIRRHVVAATDILIGQQIKEADVVLKRTSSNNPCTDIQSVYNKTPKYNVTKNSAIIAADLA